ncbi:hypothetical protein PG995_003258 [Apiospora arundinis]
MVSSHAIPAIGQLRTCFDAPQILVFRLRGIVGVGSYEMGNEQPGNRALGMEWSPNWFPKFTLWIMASQLAGSAHPGSSLRRIQTVERPNRGLFGGSDSTVPHFISLCNAPNPVARGGV